MKLFHIGAWESYAQTKLLKVMKLTALLLTIFSLHVAAHSSAQITYQAKNEPMKKVLDVIRVQAGIHMAYNDQVIDLAKPVTVTLKNTSVKEALEAIFKDQPLTYSIVGKSVFVIKRNGEVSDNASSSAEPKLIDIKWKLVNAKGEPIAGATISVRGKNMMTTSNEAGEFSFSGIEENATLVISSVSYASREVKVNGKTENSIDLQIKSTELSEVNVTLSTGYQQIQRDRITGSYAILDNKQFNRAVSSDVLSRMKGMMSGVLFDNTSGDPLGITVRNRNTINSTTKPLIIVDNFPYNLDLGTINPNDIESIAVLKDAASAAVWGAFSGNGVIVITTKKGRYNQPLRININSNLTIGQKPDLFYDRAFLNSKSYIQVEKFLYDNGFYDGDLSNTFSYPLLTQGVEIYDQLKKGLITQAEADQRINALSQTDVRQDYDKYLYQHSVNQQHAVSLTGGNDKSNYYLSIGYDQGISNLVGNKTNRVTINSNLNFNPIKQLEINGGIYFSQLKDINNASGVITSGGRFTDRLYPYAKLADENGTPINIYKDYNNSFITSPQVKGLLDWQYNPLLDRDYYDRTNKTLENRLFASIKINILKGLNAEMRYQYQKRVIDGNQIMGRQSYYVRDLINSYSIISLDSVTGYNIPNGDILSTSNSTITNSNGRAQLNYSGNWKRHAVTSLAGVDFTETKTQMQQNTFFNYNNETGSFSLVDYRTSFPTYPTGIYSLIPSLGDGISPYKLDRYRSYFFNTVYSYNNKYNLSISARMDQSNLFGVKTNQKSIPLLSFGTKWDIARENFITSSWLDDLSLRGSFGYRGNVNKTITAFTLIQNQGTNSYNNSPYSSIIYPGNSELRWEKVQTLNIGLDFGIGNKVLYGSFDYYFNKGTDLIGDAFLPTSSGFTTGRGNYANMKGHGFDLVINTTNLNKQIKWTTTFLLSYAADKVTKNEGVTTFVLGQPVASMYSYKWGGLDETGDPLGYLSDTITKDYTKIINAYTTDRSRFIAHNISPQVYGSILNTFNYKNIGLSVNIIYKLKYYFRRSALSYNSLFNNGKGNIDYDNRWQQKGDESKTDIPGLVYISYPQFSSRENFYAQSEALVEKGDHVRIQDISLSYDFQKSILKSLHLSGLQIYVYANNIGIIWRDNNKGIDPDARTGYPNPRAYSFGARVSL
jgi:TonB-linked SusC/RagA family outer membrane protein